MSFLFDLSADKFLLSEKDDDSSTFFSWEAKNLEDPSDFLGEICTSSVFTNSGFLNGINSSCSSKLSSMFSDYL